MPRKTRKPAKQKRRRHIPKLDDARFRRAQRIINKIMSERVARIQNNLTDSPKSLHP